MNMVIDDVVRMLNNGMNVADIAEAAGIAKSTVYKYARKNGVDMRKRDGAVKSYVSDYDTIVRQMLNDGCSYQEIADKIGAKRENVKWYCREHGYNSKKKQTLSSKTVGDRVKAVDGKLEYVTGYKNHRSRIIVRCGRCGAEYETRLDFLEKRGCCLACDKARREAETAQRNAERIEKALAHNAEIKLARERKLRERKEQIEKLRQERLHPCPVCGIVTDRKKYCSDKCRRKAENKTREMRRRIKIRAAMVDPDITLEGLYKRDEGRCYICGMQTLLTDYVTKDGTQICGDWYPSIDHVVPLSHGGLHSWSNVKLAHRRCNYKKGDSML